jgi:hypothetical protein
MDELTDEFIRKTLRFAAKQPAPICKKVVIALTVGDHVTIKELLPGVFE